MNNFELIIRARNGHVGVDAGGEKIKMEDLAVVCGVVQILAGEMSLRSGKDIEDVESAMLDIHLAAMLKVRETAEEMEMWSDEQG